MVIHISMELKVWVDNIKRVICGVTDNTTCQDIVIALAQAMGRTGRFTLIEKWRDNERPLAPNECPLIVLQKWGEFANEVSLVLYESGSRRKHKTVEKETNDVQKPQDRFTHNFTPPVKTNEAVIRRSLTFSGIRKPETVNFNRKHDPADFQMGQPGAAAGGHDRMSARPGPGSTNWSNNSSIPPQTSVAMATNERASRAPGQRSVSASRVRSSSHDRNHPSHHHMVQQPERFHRPNQPQAPYTSQPTSQYQQFSSHPPHHHPPATQHIQYDTQNHSSSQPSIKQTQHNQPYVPHQRPDSRTPTTVQAVNQNHSRHQATDDRRQPSPMSNGPSSRTSAFKPVHPRHSSSDDDSMKYSKSDIPVYTNKIKTSQKQDLEEYDLDSNFPDVVKETGREFLIEEYQMPGSRSGQGQVNSNHGYVMSAEEQERVKLLRLVTMQNERMKMQDSQLDIIDTEITSREEKLEDTKIKLDQILNEIEDLSGQLEDQGSEMVTLDNGMLIEEMEKEKHTEKDIKNEISALKGRLEKCENNLHQFHTKVKLCSEDLEHEQEVQEADEARRLSVETKLQREISELCQQISELDSNVSGKKEKSEELETELETTQKQVTEKSETLTTLEKELQKENLKFFQEPVKHSETKTVKHNETKPAQKSMESNGEAVLKVLEGSISPHVKRVKIAASPLNLLSISKNKNGVWV